MTTTLPQQGTPPSGSPARFKTFRALRYRNFRLLWISLIVSSVGTWMQIVAQSLLVLAITNHSAFALGTVSLAQASSFFIFAFIGGSVADRIDKRRLLLFTQTLSMLLAALLGVLTLTGQIQFWMVVVIAFCSGTVLSFDQPTRSALIPTLVPREDLMNAISLQSIVFNGSAFIGPALAGIMIGVLAQAGHALGLHGPLIGYAGNFLLNAVSFLGVLVVLFLLQVPHDAEASERRAPLLNSIKSSLSTVRRDSVLPWVLSGYGIMLFFGPSTSLILPIFATQILHLTDAQLGLLFSASGLGTILGALMVASLGEVKKKGWLMLGSLLIWASALLLFAFSTVFWLSLLTLLIFGIAQNGVGATTITLMQTRVPPQMRGRVMSLNTLMIMGIRPLGDFPAGAAIGLIGGPLTVCISSLIIGGYTLFLLLTRPTVRDVV
ncbi:MFS transporter [Ktedonobacter racemifer]|uniref:Major facilitator superfamily MFS_1 n=1 Tax=Ktedonobacter racemifer DSM 44963 TaxID=485913 RepID=D6TRS0_KTERA|nr:MFS transporter [Ktedonobacter racemifer]EFH86022.1 major facilitator superfamily MFS_1 [Ktedonobacter racemifer DSM 44963]